MQYDKQVENKDEINNRNKEHFRNYMSSSLQHYKLTKE